MFWRQPSTFRTRRQRQRFAQNASHHQPPARALDTIELAPFAHAFDHGMGAVMVAHLDIPSLDSTEAQPSTLSPLIVDSLLRGEMGFEGLVFTDAMSMKGFADFVGDRPRIRDAILAGNDVLLFPGGPEAPLQTMAAMRMAP